jgi:hypothetical protein
VALRVSFRLFRKKTPDELERMVLPVCFTSVLNIYEASFWYGRKHGTSQMVLEQRTPVMIAALFGSVDVLNYTLSTYATHGLDINSGCGSDNNTGLHLCSLVCFLVCILHYCPLCSYQRTTEAVILSVYISLFFLLFRCSMTICRSIVNLTFSPSIVGDFPIGISLLAMSTIGTSNLRIPMCRFSDDTCPRC